MKIFSKKIGIFYIELKHASFRNVKRLLTRPLKILRYLSAFFKYPMILNAKLPHAEKSLKNAPNSFKLFGDFEELHNRIAGRQNDFKKSIEQIKKLLAQGQEVKIILGLSRHNFARLNKIAELALSILGKEFNSSTIELKVFPVQDLPENFISYVESIKKQIDSEKISISFCDEQLMDILNTVGLHAKVDPGREKDLLRLLGIISEQVLIGPQTIVFDPFHRCNAKCQHCWVHTPEIKHPEEFLNRKFDFELFKQIIDDASGMMTDGIILQGDGEPLMYDKFMPMLKYARSKNLGVLFFTNGILLDEEKSKEIIDLGANEIYCSFPAGTSQTYEKVASIQPAETFYKIRDNLKNFMILRRKSAKNSPRLIISHVIHNMNYMNL